MQARQQYIAMWLRLFVQKEIRAAYDATRLFKSQATLVANTYKTEGEFATIRKTQNGLNDWVRLLVTNYSRTITEFANFTREQIKTSLKKQTFLDLVQSFIAREALRKSQFIVGTNVELVRDAITDGVGQGLGELDIAKGIKEALGGAIAIPRARTIARTEVHNAATYAMQEIAQSSNLNLMREWVSVHDERTRDAHVEADGQIRGLNEPFDVGGESIDRPGEGSPENSINCRCTIAYIPQENSL